jgi:tetratricopeptide (TPR) repeat protein
MFRRALELSPDAAGYHFMLGTVLRLEGKLPAAVEEFKAELARHPEDMMAARQVADSEAALKRRTPSPQP